MKVEWNVKEFFHTEEPSLHNLCLFEIHMHPSNHNFNCVISTTFYILFTFVQNNTIINGTASGLHELEESKESFTSASNFG
jgi:hypothetical protein